MLEERAFMEDHDVYVAIPDDKPRAWVMGVHGSGREALSYRDVPFYAVQRDLALSSGCAFASISLGKDVWAKPYGFALLEKLHVAMCLRGYASACVVMASSAGGAQMFRFAQIHPQKIRALIGIFPVWDVESITLASLQAAWQLPAYDLREALKERNPARFPQQLPHVPIVICQGLQDRAVSPQKNALSLQAVFPVQLHLTQDAHSIQAFSLYDTPLLSQTLQNYSNEVRALCL